MSADLPPVGAAITVVAPRSTHRFEDKQIFLRAYVMSAGSTHRGTEFFAWNCGRRIGEISLTPGHEFEWTYGHGPKARAALATARALRPR